MALTVAGLPTDRFFFEGFLPPKEKARRTRIGELVRASRQRSCCSRADRALPQRLPISRRASARAKPPSCRELTKLHEEVRRADLTALARHYAAGAETRGEFVIVIAPAGADEQPSADDIDALLRAALARTSLKDAVAEVAAATGEPRRAVYGRALELTKNTMRRTGPKRPAVPRRRAPSGRPRSRSASRPKAAPPRC